MLTWAVVGSRDYPDLEKVRAFVEGLAGWVDGYEPPQRRLCSVLVISGGARGVDKAAYDHAKLIRAHAQANGWDDQGFDGIELPADWTRGPIAGFERNVDIVRAADQLTAFWDGLSSGTVHSIVLAHQKGIPVLVRWGAKWVTVNAGDPLPGVLRDAYAALRQRWGDKLPVYTAPAAELEEEELTAR